MNISKTLPPPPKATHCGSIPGEKKNFFDFNIYEDKSSERAFWGAKLPHTVEPLLTYAHLL